MIPHGKDIIHLKKVRFDGILTVTNAELFKKVLTKGLGHGKAYGLGMMSISPI